MIRVGGENVSAFEVEEVVNSHPSVAESAAIPVDDPYKGEEIKVFIRPVEGIHQLDFVEMVKWCAKKLAYFKVPRYFELVAELPKTPTQRIQKNLLKVQERGKQDHGWDRNALRLGSPIVGFVLQNWITRRLNLWRFRRGDHPNKTCLAGGELFDGSFRSFN